jgi:hypothetical protein
MFHLPILAVEESLVARQNEPSKVRLGGHAQIAGRFPDFGVDLGRVLEWVLGWNGLNLGI